MIKDIYYVTVAAGERYIRSESQYAIRSLRRLGDFEIHCVVPSKSDQKLLTNLVGSDINVHVLKEDLSYVVWKYAKGIRKYSLFKSASLHKVFGTPREDSSMLYFDGDVLWYKDPTDFLLGKSDRTWFHHGKILAERSKVKKSDVDITKVGSLSKWISEPCAMLMIENGATRMPDREAVAGLYLMHPRDHEKVLALTYEGCKRNARRCRQHEGAGDQKPMNAALNILDIDWHGGLRFDCPDHIRYFEHFMSTRKFELPKMAWKLGLIKGAEGKRISKTTIRRPVNPKKLKDKGIVGQILEYEKKRHRFLSDFFGTKKY